MAMTLGTLALKFFENFSSVPLTHADLMALSPQTDFKTHVPAVEWTNIAVFGCTEPDATGQAHFVIETRGGRPVVRTTDLWRQQSATPATPRDPACIAISLKGDFSRQAPTAAQMDALANLTCMLQQISHIPRQNVTTRDLGNAFPTEKFDKTLLR